MSEIEIRQLTEKDAEAYRDARLYMLQEKPEAFSMSTYDEAVSKDISYFSNLINQAPIFGVFDNNIIVGTAGYSVKSGKKLDHKAYIWGVYLKPEYRGKGLSHKLMDMVMKDIPLSVELIQLNVITNNEAALGLYKSMGFKDFGYEKKALKIGTKYYDQYHMVKFLEESS